MTRNIRGVALLFALAGMMVAAASGPVGTWECVSADPNGGSGEMTWTLDVKEVNGKLVGTAGNYQGEISIDDAKFENDTLTFSVSLDSGTYEITLKVNGDKLDGSWKGGGETGAIKGTKKA